MKLTNKANLPEVFVRAIENDSYDRGDCDFTATELILPPQIRALRERYKDQIEEDVADKLWALFGQLGHALLEKAGGHNEITEKRYFATIGGFRISAQVDSLNLTDMILSDWKMTTVWGFIEGRAPKPEFVAQLNIQLELLRENGLDAKDLQIVGLLRDWQMRDVLNRRGYPKNQVAVQPIPMWDREKTRGFILAKAIAHKQAHDKGIWRGCTDEEIWNGRRCESYCSVSKFCTQYQNTIPNIKEHLDGKV